MSKFVPENATEAVADAWASLDGRLDNFRRGKKAKSGVAYESGAYSGYMFDAEELVSRLKRRGYALRKLPSKI